PQVRTGKCINGICANSARQGVLQEARFLCFFFVTITHRVAPTVFTNCDSIQSKSRPSKGQSQVSNAQV
ncbi:MAG: hypothetical protein ACP5RV_10130, partial [Thiomonas sp.]